MNYLKEKDLLDIEQNVRTKKTVNKVKLYYFNNSLFYSRKWDSNPRPTHYECVALPTEPFRQVTFATCFSILANTFKVKNLLTNKFTVI